jgi:hypothetical protein
VTQSDLLDAILSLGCVQNPKFLRSDSESLIRLNIPLIDTPLEPSLARTPLPVGAIGPEIFLGETPVEPKYARGSMTDSEMPLPKKQRVVKFADVA